MSSARPVPPASATLVAWGNAWLAGHCGADEVVDVLESAHGPQVVAAVEPGGGAPDRAPTDVPLRGALNELRATGIIGFRLALPTPGDPLGLAGPVEFTEAAVAAREAVIVERATPLGLVPVGDERGSSYAGVRWTRHEPSGTPVPTPTLAEAEQELALTLRNTADSLLALNVADWHPEAARALAEIRRGDDAGGLAPGYSSRAHRVAAQAARLDAISSFGLADDGGALTRWEADERRTTLRELERACRRARVAAYNSVAEPG